MPLRWRSGSVSVLSRAWSVGNALVLIKKKTVLSANALKAWDSLAAFKKIEAASSSL